MEWIVQALRVIREIRDWADERSMPEKSREALMRAAEWMETAMEESRRLEVEPIGPVTQKGEAPSDDSGISGQDGPAHARTSNGRAASPLDVHPAQPPRRERPQRRLMEGARANVPPDSPVQEIPLEKIDPHALEVIRRLRRFGHRAYLVGGCVRDLLLGLKPKDFDVATSARPEEVKALFRNSRVIGRRFRLVHVFFRGGKIIETSTFRAQAVPQEEEGEEPGQQDLLIRRDNVFGTEEEDARRRDFTINALFYDIGKGQIIDHVDGLKDIRQRLLRMIGDPDVRLREDPVRILRAIRIAAKASLTIEPELLKAISRHKQDISRCAPARVLEETLRLLRIGHAGATVRMMEDSGVLDFLLPEISTYLESPRVPADLPRISRDEEEEVSEEPPAMEPGADLSSRELFYRHLVALDRLIARGPVSDGVVLGALFYAPVSDIQRESEAEGMDRIRATSEFLQMVGARLVLTRRLAEHLRQIFIAQRHFARVEGDKRHRRRPSPTSLMRRSFFPDALDLYEVHATAVGLELADVERWRQMASREGAPIPHEDQRRRRPRRRRGGRGRGRATT
jgi:poly(A) polymerase